MSARFWTDGETGSTQGAPVPRSRIAPPERHRTRGPHPLVLERVLLAVGLALVAACALARLDTAAYQRLASARLSCALASARSADGADLSGAGEGDEMMPRILGRVEIPRVGISAIVARGCDEATLRRAVGHVAGTALPGESGNVCLAGHRDSFFRGLMKMTKGDTIRVVTLDGARDYGVSSIAVVDPRRTEVLAPTPVPTLTLITCYPFHSIGPARQRFIVRAEALALARAPAL